MVDREKSDYPFILTKWHYINYWNLDQTAGKGELPKQSRLN
jgi:hypothetical protein